MLWAQLKILPRLVWTNFVAVLSLLFFAIFLMVFASVMAQELVQPKLTIFTLAVSLFAGILMVGRQGMTVSQDEWVLAQPLNAQTFATFSWLTSAALWFCFWAAIIVPPMVCAAVSLSKVVEFPSVLLLVVVLALNSLIGSFVTASRLGKHGLALVGQVWHIWMTFVLLPAFSIVVIIVVIIAVITRIYGDAIAIEWMSKIARWVETPTGMSALLPIMPAYFAVKSVMEGFNFTAVLWLVLLALIGLVILLGALELARPFNEASFLQSQRMRRLSAMRAWDTPIAERERIRSVSGFGEGETALLWLNWLSLRRTYGIALELSAPVTAFVSFSMLFLLRGVKEITLSMAGGVVLPFVALPLILFLPPEWLKSQPISVQRGLIMQAFPQTVRTFLVGIGILLAVTIFQPEILSVIQVTSFVAASFGVGLSIGFLTQATKFSLAVWMIQRNFAVMFLHCGIVMCFAFLWFMTLTDFWLFGLLLTWGCCGLTYEWAKFKWHDVP